MFRIVRSLWVVNKSPGSIATETPVKFQSIALIQITELAATRLCWILWLDVFLDIDTGPTLPTYKSITGPWEVKKLN